MKTDSNDLLYQVYNSLTSNTAKTFLAGGNISFFLILLADLYVLV